MSQRGSIRLSMVVAAALGVGFAASIFLNYQQHQRAEQDKKLLQGEIVDLRYQVQQDQIALHGGATPSPTASPTASPSSTPEASAPPSPTPSATPAVAGANTTAPQTATLKMAANVRKEANSTSTKLFSMLPKGTVVTLGTDVRNGYQQITVNGKTGYILASALE